MKLDVFRSNTVSREYPPTLRVDDTTQPFSVVYIKVLDCGEDNYPVWQGYFDPEVLPREATAEQPGVEGRLGSPGDLEAVKRQLEMYWNQGIGAVPWGVSRGYHPRAEGRMAGEAAALTARGVFILDLEPYDLYWTAPGTTCIHEWMDGFLTAGGRELWISTDSRNTKPAELHLDVWLSYGAVTRVMPQAYWTDFGQDWKTGVDASYLPLTLPPFNVPVERIYPTYPLNATLDDLRAAIQYATAAPAFGGVSLWCRGIASQGVLDALLSDPQPVFPEAAQEPVPAPPAPTPTPAPQPPEQSSQALSDAYEAGRAAGYAAGEAAGYRTGVVASLQAVRALVP